MCSSARSPTPRSRIVSRRCNAVTKAGPLTRTGARRSWSKRLERAPSGTCRSVSSWACCSALGTCASRCHSRSAVRSRTRATRRSKVVTPGSKTLRPWDPQRYQQEAHSPASKLPEGDLVFFLLDTVPRLDLHRLYAPYEQETRGAPPFDPAMMVCLLL